MHFKTKAFREQRVLTFFLRSENWASAKWLSGTVPANTPRCHDYMGDVLIAFPKSANAHVWLACRVDVHDVAAEHATS